MTELTYILVRPVTFFNEGNGWTGPRISLILRLTRLLRTEMTDGIGPVRPDAIISLQGMKRISSLSANKTEKSYKINRFLQSLELLPILYVTRYRSTELKIVNPAALFKTKKQMNNRFHRNK
jgi:hypothetical protein